MSQTSEAASNSKAIIEELKEQVKSYLGLLEESEERIEKVKCVYTCSKWLCRVCIWYKSATT